MQTCEKNAVIITGAGQGLGLAFAERLAVDGWPVVLTDIAPSKAEDAACELRERGFRALGMTAEVCDPDAMQDVVSQTMQEFDGIEGLVNNASIFSSLKMRSFDEIPLAEWRRVIDVNLTGVFVCCTAVASSLKARGSGSIVNISSAVVPMGRPNYMHYVASKAGVVGMTRSMARELGPWNIRVNAVLPGATETGIPRETVTPQQREALIAMRSIRRAQVPQDLTGVVAFLMQADSSFITGQSLVVDGGTVFL